MLSSLHLLFYDRVEFWICYVTLRTCDGPSWDDRHNDIVSLRHDGEPILCFVCCHEFAIMLENHLRRISRFERDFAHVLHHGDAIRDERMTQPVVLPLQAGERSEIHGELLRHIREWRDWSGSMRVAREPGCE